MNLSKIAKIGGKMKRISKAEQKAPFDKVKQIFAAIWEAKEPIIKVTITRIEEEQRMV